MKPFVAGMLAGGLIAVLALGVGMTLADRDDMAAETPAQGNAGSSPVESEAVRSPDSTSPAAQQIQAMAPDTGAHTLPIDGVTYALAVNESGAVLTSADGRTIYLGRSCDVQSDQFGRGRWEWSNAGFAIRFNGQDITFPRMDPPLDADECEA